MNTYLLRFYESEPVALEAEWFTMSEFGDAQFYDGDELVAVCRNFLSIQKIVLSDGGELTYNHAIEAFERSAAPDMDEDIE